MIMFALFGLAKRLVSAMQPIENAQYAKVVIEGQVMEVMEFWRLHQREMIARMIANCHNNSDDRVEENYERVRANEEKT